MSDWQAIMLTLKLALTTSVILLVICFPLAAWLASSRHPLKVSLQALLTLPLVLPPTVLGFYLLLLFAPHSPVGQVWMSLTGSQLAFSFASLVIGSIVYSLPFALQPIYNGFLQLNPRYMEYAKVMNMPRIATLRYVVLPLLKPNLLIAFCLSFAHTVGEFGVVLMIGGSIPNQTKVVSIALYEHVETLNYSQAHTLAAILMLFSFALLVLLYSINRKAR